MSLEEKLKIKVVSQTQHIFEGNAYEVILPAVAGNIGILPGHTSLISLLQIGEIITKTNEAIKKFIISGGLAYVKDDIITVLADEAVLPEKLVSRDIEQAIEDAKKQKSSELDAAELIQLEKQLRFEMFKKKFLEENK